MQDQTTDQDQTPMQELAIDYLCGHFTEDNIRRNFFESTESEIFEAVGRLKNLHGYTAPEFLQHLEGLGIGRIIIPTLLTWDYWHQRPIEETFVEEVAVAHAEFPDRIWGLYGVNPRKRMEGVREMEDAILHKGFKGLHLHPHGFGLPPNHAWYMPYYAKCAELGAVVVVSMGHTLDFMPGDVARPMYLDDVALYFPDLTIVCGHTGWPWVEEAIALASKHPNVYLGTSGYAPRYWRPEMLQFMDSRRGRHKTIWGTDYPLVRHEESMRQIAELNLKPETVRALLNENASQGLRSGVIRELRIERPERRNALDRATIARLRGELQAASHDGSTRVVVIASAGTEAFCAGQDIKELATLNRAERLAAHGEGQALMDEIEAHPCLVIAAIEGFCLGGGLELALACDARIAGESATFGLPEVGRDLLPTWGAHHRLSRVIGLGRAKELVLLGRRLTAQEATAWGLVAERTPTGAARDRAVALGQEATQDSSRGVIAQAKALVTAGFCSGAGVAQQADAMAEAAQL